MKVWCFAAVAVLLVMNVSAATLYVDLSSTNPVPPYDSWATAATTIEDAVNEAEALDTVLVTNGTYLLAAPIVVHKDMTIASVHGERGVIVDGGGAVRCFELGNRSCVINGLVVSHAYSSGEGGGIYCTGDNPVVTNCVITGCSSDSHGGGMRFGKAFDCGFFGNTAAWGAGASWTVAERCVFSNNVASSSGGGMSGAGGLAMDCRFIGNRAVSQGGGLIEGTATNCLFELNSTDGDGGGMKLANAFNCTLVSNSASWGAGASWTVAEQCCFSNNMASGSGGGMSGASSVAVRSSFIGNSAVVQGGGCVEGFATNCVFALNSTDGDGGGIKLGHAFNCTLVSNSAALGSGQSWGSALNCIVWGNVGDDLNQVSCESSCSPDLLHGTDGNITNSPMFVDTVGGDYRLGAGSPCMDVGVLGAGVDFEGVPRPLDGDADGIATVDLGAYEFLSEEADTDGDGQSDYNEWMADTGLLDRDDFFQISAYSNHVVIFQSSAKRVYSLLKSRDLTSGRWRGVAGQVGVPGGGEMDMPSRRVAGGASGFYQVVVGVPPEVSDHAVAWGTNDWNQMDLPVEQGFSQLVAGDGYILGLTPEGMIEVYGSIWHANGMRNTMPSGKFIELSAKRGHALARRADGSLVGFGDNYFGQADVPAGAFKAFAAGSNHSLAVKKDGSLAAWGYADYGQCNVPAGNHFVRVDGGEYHSMALRENGWLTVFGGVQAERYDVVDFAAGWGHCVILYDDGTVEGIGANTHGQAESPAGYFVAVWAGGDTSAAMRSDGTYVIWGNTAGGRGIFGPNADPDTISIGYQNGVGLEK